MKFFILFTLFLLFVHVLWAQSESPSLCPIQNDTPTLSGVNFNWSTPSFHKDTVLFSHTSPRSGFLPKSTIFKVSVELIFRCNKCRNSCFPVVESKTAKEKLHIVNLMAEEDRSIWIGASKNIPDFSVKAFCSDSLCKPVKIIEFSEVDLLGSRLEVIFHAKFSVHCGTIETEDGPKHDRRGTKKWMKFCVLGLLSVCFLFQVAGYFFIHSIAI